MKLFSINLLTQLNNLLSYNYPATGILYDCIKLIVESVYGVRYRGKI